MARILVVDDSVTARRMLGKMILSLGHTVAGEAADGEEAFAEYARLKPDIVTMDLTMAVHDGAQATSKILLAYPEACIIMVSARQDQRLILDSLERGARHFLVKPVSQDRLSTVLNNVLQQKFDKQKHLAMVRSMREAAALQSPGGKKSREAHKKIPARVLIVDDSAVARNSLRGIVTALGHTVVGEAANGTQAFVEYTRLKPDVVTMDLTMDGLGGAEAISKIIAVHPEARIIVVSAMEARRGIIDALERGARHFIVKPIRQEKVAAAIDNILQQHSDLQKHREQVRKLKAAEELSTIEADAANSNLSPYAVHVQEGKVVYVVLNQSLTLNSCRSLTLELEEYLNGTPRVLFDFGRMTNLDLPLLDKINELIGKINRRSGKVKAVSGNTRFVDLIRETKRQDNLLAGILHYLEN